MPEDKRIREPMSTNEIAKKAIFSYLHRMGAPMEQLRALRSVSIVSETQKIPWLQAAVFMGQSEISIVDQRQGKQAMSLKIETKSTGSFRTFHNVIFTTNAPVIELSDSESPIRPTSSILRQHLKETSLGTDSYSMAHIVLDDNAPKANGQTTKYRVKQGIFVTVPNEIQEELKIKLGTENLLIATAFRKI